MSAGTAPLPGMEDPVREDVRQKALVVANASADLTTAKGKEKKAREELHEFMKESPGGSFRRDPTTPPT